MSATAPGPNLARPEHGAMLAVSSARGRAPEGPPKEELAARGYFYTWQDGSVQPMGCCLWTEGVEEAGGEWVEVAWAEPQSFGAVVLRLPPLVLLAEPRRTLGRLVLELWDAEASSWRPAKTTNGQPNPLRDWVAPPAPAAPADLLFAFEPVRTGRLRVRIEEGTSDSWCFLDEIEVYGDAEERQPSPPDPPADAHPAARGGRALAEELAEARRWLERVAAEHVRGSRVEAFDGTVMYTPDGVGSYDGFWVRDFQYMVEGAPSAIPLADLERGIEYLISRQREDGAMPNKVFKDGTPRFCPGPGCESVFGPAPPPDNPSFMVKLAHHHRRLGGGASLFVRHRQALERGMRFVPRSPATSLVYIDPTHPSSPYGFSDAVAKTGDQLFDSLLWWEAASRLADLLAEAGDAAAATTWRREATVVADDLQTLRDPDSGMFLAASVDCRQIDVWGSALAAHLGVIPGDQRLEVAAWLRANYDGVVCRGQVRHVAPGEHWQRTLVPGREIYQDGPYWALPAGWVAQALAPADRELAQRMLVDLVRDFQLHGVNEAINPAVGYVAIPRYVASATAPLPAFAALAADPDH
ncbi:MAG: hypothetical protein JSS97_16135 [Actinobacteria bacterium]|nr:hypothetical protein [Actinomycetota bacterium]